MNAAIKALEDTLLIRRLQERELAHESGHDPARVSALQAAIASLERGLRLLTEEDARRRTPDAGPKVACALRSDQQPNSLQPTV